MQKIKKIIHAMHGNMLLAQVGRLTRSASVFHDNESSLYHGQTGPGRPDFRVSQAESRKERLPDFQATVLRDSHDSDGLRHEYVH